MRTGQDCVADALMSPVVSDVRLDPLHAPERVSAPLPVTIPDSLSRLHSAAQALADIPDSPAFFERLVEVALEVLEADRCAWLFWDEKDRLFHLGPVAGGQMEAKESPLPWPGTVNPESFQAPFILAGPAHTWPLPDRPLKPILQALHVKSALVVPLWQGATLLGLLVAGRASGMPPFGPEALRLASALMAQAETARRYIQRLEMLERYAVRLALAQRMNLSIAANLDENAICHTAVNVLTRDFGYPQCSLHLVRGEELVLEAQAGPGGAPARLVLDQGVIAFIMRTGRALFLPANDGGEELPSGLPGLGVRALVPLRQGQRILGLLQVESPADGPPLEEMDLRFLEAVAVPLATALEKARLYEQEQRWSRKLHAINELGRRLSAILKLDLLVEKTVESLTQAFEFDQVTLYLNDHLPSPPPPAIAWVVEHGQSLALSSAGDHLGTALLPPLGMSYELVIPIRLADRVTGVIDLQSVQPRDLAVDDIALLESLAGQIAVALENARLYEQIRSNAHLLESMVAARTRHLSTLHAVTAAVSRRLDLDGIAGDTLNEIRRLMGLPGAAFFLTEDGGRRTEADSPSVRCIASYGLSEATSRAAEAAAHQAVTSREPVWLAPLECDPVLAVPLVVPEDCLGALVVSGRLTPEDSDVLIAVGRELGVAVNNARLYAAVQRYAEELKASQDRLVESERMAAMGKLSAAIAHEINNPLQAIQTHLGLALEEAEAGEPVDPDNLRIAASEIQRTGQLIHQFLDFYRPAVGEIALVDVDIILDEVLRLVEQKLSKAQVRLERHWSPMRPMVRAHAGRLKQVFLNLLLNAIDAMPNGGQIDVRTEVEGEQVRVHVSDTGHGIPAEVMPHLFEPFFTTKTRGIGMGLFVSQGIIHHYGGDIRVTSQPGQGTTFTVSLPCSAEQGEKAP